MWVKYMMKHSIIKAAIFTVAALALFGFSMLLLEKRGTGAVYFVLLWLTVIMGASALGFWTASAADGLFHKSNAVKINAVLSGSLLIISLLAAFYERWSEFTGWGDFTSFAILFLLSAPLAISFFIHMTMFVIQICKSKTKE